MQDAKDVADSQELDFEALFSPSPGDEVENLDAGGEDDDGAGGDDHVSLDENGESSESEDRMDGEDGAAQAPRSEALLCDVCKRCSEDSSGDTLYCPTKFCWKQGRAIVYPKYK